jgi:hypothetical protein
MTLNGWAQIALFCGLVLLLTRPLGGYLDNVMAGRRTLLLLRLQDLLPLNPQGFAGGAAGSRLQHGGQLRHQHQLAELWRRDHHEPTSARWRADGAELRVGRHRHRLAVALIRGFARGRPKTLGNFWVDLTRATLYVLLPLASSSRSPSSGRACRRRSTPRRRDHARRRAADHRARPGRQPGRDQAARHQWRRLLQRQRRPSVREPDASPTISRSRDPR